MILNRINGRDVEDNEGPAAVRAGPRRDALSLLGRPGGLRAYGVPTFPEVVRHGCDFYRRFALFLIGGIHGGAASAILLQSEKLLWMSNTDGMYPPVLQKGFVELNHRRFHRVRYRPPSSDQEQSHE